MVGGLAREELSTARGDAELLRPSAGGSGIDGSRVLRLAPRLLPQRAIHAAVPLVDGRVLIAGGNLSGVIEWFVPGEGGGRFVAGPRLPGGAGRAGIVGARLPDGRVLLVGGVGPDGAASAVTELFDPSSDELAPGPRLLEPRRGHTVSVLADGRVLIAGGLGRSSTEWFDPETDTLRAGPRMRRVRDDHRAAVLADGRVLLSGGQDGAGRSQSSIEALDADGTVFRELAPLLHARADHAQVVLPDGAVLWIGGEDDDGVRDVVLDTVERWDPTTARAEVVATLAAPRDDAQAVLLADGRVLVIGGLGEDGEALATSEWLSFD